MGRMGKKKNLVHLFLLPNKFLKNDNGSSFITNQSSYVFFRANSLKRKLKANY